MDRPPQPSDPFQPELVDEGPGSYLAELGTRRFSVLWGAINLLLTLAIGMWAWGSGLSEESEWYPVLRLCWSLLPISALLLVIVTVWQLGTAYTLKPPGRILLALAFSFASLGGWWYFSHQRGVLQPVEPAPAASPERAEEADAPGR